MNEVRIARDCLAVTGACLATPRELFDAARRAEHDAARSTSTTSTTASRSTPAAAASSTTPTSSLFHFESSTREAVVEEWEVLQMVRRWGQVAAVDPYGNPNLRLGPAPRLRLPQLGASAAAAGCGSCGWLSEQVPPDGESGQDRA